MSRHRRELQSGESETTTTPLPESFQKTLKATANLFNALLPDDVLKIWKDLLNYCSEREAVTALKQWHYQGAYFPKPHEILQLVADAREKVRIEKTGCSTECQKRHGLGYDLNDVRWLLGRRMQDHGRRWKKEQWDALFDELDAKRFDGAPIWRKDVTGTDQEN